jgi:hypothetical protein
VEVEKNEPKLADVRAPWDAGWRHRDVLKPKNFWSAIAYNRKYVGFWAPTSMGPWRYRRLLRDLDEVCLRSLKSHGALTAKELADWLNLEGLLRTKPELTGIHRISVATASDWINLARRRGYVGAWGGAQGGCHWALTEQGQQAIHSKLVTLAGRVPYGWLVPLLLTGGGLVAALNWLGRHPTAIAAIVYGLLLALYLGALTFWFGRSERRNNPGIAVVAIETLRSAGRPIPSLGGG